LKVVDRLIDVIVECLHRIQIRLLAPHLKITDLPFKIKKLKFQDLIIYHPGWIDAEVGEREDCKVEVLGERSVLHAQRVEGLTKGDFSKGIQCISMRNHKESDVNKRGALADKEERTS